MNENQNDYVDINAHDNYPDSEQKIEIPTMKVIPLKKICMTIGQLPTAYLETMSYYEMLIWFIEYLKNNIIPTINNNASAVQEVQSVVLALQNYINNYKDSIDSDVEELEEYMTNYFDNLDVQDEINNKLDQMLEDGVLEQIIEQYLNSSAIWGFDNVAAMKEATNLIDGSYARTLGYRNKNDGGSALYKIRTITNDDVVDEATIIALADDTLIAELMEIKINKYIDLRWLGADSTGTEDASQYLLKALQLSNDNYVTPIKVFGHYYLGSEINFTGAVSMFGLHTPGTEDFLYTQETTDYTLDSPSEFILNNNITAINLKGIGNNTKSIAVLNLKNIFITEKDKLKTSTFIDVNAFGGPSRPNIIREVGANGINTLLSAIHNQTTTYTNLMNVDMAGINCYNCGTVLNFPTLSTNNEGLMNLNLHDSIIENSKNIILKSLGVYNQIKSNLLENLSEDSYISIKTASSLEFTGNYFESNDNDIIFDVYPVYSNNEVADLGSVEFRDNMTYSNQNDGKFIFNNLSVNLIGYYTTFNFEFKNCFLKIDNWQYNEPTIKLNQFIKDSTINFNHIRFKDTIYKTSNELEFTSNNYAYPSSFPTTAYEIAGNKCWKLDGNSHVTLLQSISHADGDYIGLLFYKGGNRHSSLQISLLDGNSIAHSHIPVANSPVDGYYLYITKVDGTSPLNLYLNNRTTNDFYLSPIKLINFGQDLTASIQDKLTLYI